MSRMVWRLLFTLKLCPFYCIGHTALKRFNELQRLYYKNGSDGFHCV